MKELPIIQETQQWIAVNKPGGLNVEQLWDYPSVEAEVRKYLQGGHTREPFVGIVHRLDRPVSGVLLLAKKKSTLKLLNEQFAQHTIQKTYWAVTEGIPAAPTGTLTHYLVKDQKNKRALATTHKVPQSSLATLSYQVLETANGRALLEIKPLSGKYHQIRVQLAAANWPILGDLKYGAHIVDTSQTIALHARNISFYDPENKLINHLIADVPPRKCWLDWNGAGEL
jgi:23S rRNA pseudouridine1911/1915/1917 synthase